jgi:predicted SAM-dependent methyltransferase
MKKYGWIPSFIREALVAVRNYIRRLKCRRELLALSHQPVKKIIVGSEGDKFEGWITTEQDVLNLLIVGDWHQFFSINSLDAILAEHVWEHLTPQEGVVAAKNCFDFLKPGGHIRIAVPDGYNPEADYVNQVKPGGSGAGADDHKVLFTYKSLSKIFVSVGFEVSLLEYFDESGEFIEEKWNASEGFIQRSKHFDSRNTSDQLNYTSIILDAVKPVR